MTKSGTDKILIYIKKHLTAVRYKHSLGTLKVAEDIAKSNTVSLEKVIHASLLHDAGKSMSNEKMISYVKINNITVPHKEDVFKYNPSLLHSYISAAIAKKTFGINDRQTLEAISLHTVGSGRMHLLAKIIYLADAAAPDRRYPGVDNIRRQALKNLDRALLMAFENKISHVIKNKKWLHPDAVNAWNSLI